MGLHSTAVGDHAGIAGDECFAFEYGGRWKDSVLYERNGKSGLLPANGARAGRIPWLGLRRAYVPGCSIAVMESAVGCLGNTLTQNCPRPAAQRRGTRAEGGSQRYTVSPRNEPQRGNPPTQNCPRPTAQRRGTRAEGESIGTKVAGSNLRPPRAFKKKALVRNTDPG